MGGADDPAAAALPEDPGKAGNGNFAAGNEVVQDRAGAYGRELVGIPDQDDRCAGTDGAEKRHRQRQVQHGNFIQHEQLMLKGIFAVVNKLAFTRIPFEQTVERGGTDAGGLAHAFGGTSGRRGQHQIQAGGSGTADDLADHSGLADAGTAGDDAHRAFAGLFHRAELFIGKF